jgi:hypothetical protein
VSIAIDEVGSHLTRVGRKFLSAAVDVDVDSGIPGPKSKKADKNPRSTQANKTPLMESRLSVPTKKPAPSGAGSS